VVGEAGTVADAPARIPAAKPDVAILDVRLPDGSGVEVCREIRSTPPAIACVMLTSYADDEALIASIMAGAVGYVLKQVGSFDLIETIRRADAGESLLDPFLTDRVLERLREGPKVDPWLASLTPQERRILDLIAEGYTNRQIVDTMYLAEKTVKNYVSNLLAKLGMERRTQAAIFAARLSERSTQETRRPRHLTAVAGTDSSWRRRSVLGVGCCLQRDAAVHERLLQAARSCRGCSNRLGSVAMPRASASSSRATS
jgi:DNA-binding NarL/FixJ family response regulator